MSGMGGIVERMKRLSKFDSRSAPRVKTISLKRKFCKISPPQRYGSIPRSRNDDSVKLLSLYMGDDRNKILDAIRLSFGIHDAYVISFWKPEANVLKRYVGTITGKTIIQMLAPQAKQKVYFCACSQETESMLSAMEPGGSRANDESDPEVIEIPDPPCEEEIPDITVSGRRNKKPSPTAFFNSSVMVAGTIESIFPTKECANFEGQQTFTLRKCITDAGQVAPPLFPGSLNEAKLHALLYCKPLLHIVWTANEDSKRILEDMATFHQHMIFWGTKGRAPRQASFKFMVPQRGSKILMPFEAAAPASSSSAAAAATTSSTAAAAAAAMTLVPPPTTNTTAALGAATEAASTTATETAAAAAGAAAAKRAAATSLSRGPQTLTTTTEPTITETAAATTEPATAVATAPVLAAVAEAAASTEASYSGGPQTLMAITEPTTTETATATTKAATAVATVSAAVVAAPTTTAAATKASHSSASASTSAASPPPAAAAAVTAEAPAMTAAATTTMATTTKTTTAAAALAAATEAKTTGSISRAQKRKARAMKYKALKNRKM